MSFLIPAALGTGGTLSTGAALAIAGTGISAIQQFQTAKAQEKAAKQQAVVEEQATRIEVKQEREQFRRLMATQAAQFGAAGVELRGTPLDVLSETARTGAENILLTRFAGERRKTKFLGEAELAKSRRFKGATDILTTTGTTLLTGKAQKFSKGAGSISGSQGGVG